MDPMATRSQDIPGRWWERSVLAGLIGGAAFFLYKAVSLAILGIGFWAPLNMMAALFPGFRPPATTYSWGATLTGLVILGVISALGGGFFGWAAATFYPRAIRSWGKATLIGLAWGVVGGSLLTFLVATWLFPELVQASPVNFFIGCMVYELVTHWALSAWARKRDVSVSFAPEVPVARDVIRK